VKSKSGSSTTAGLKKIRNNMSYTEKHENISKDDWMNRLEGLHIQRADMNKLIMNYLVTGKQRNASSY
jgi:hypothetical protein